MLPSVLSLGPTMRVATADCFDDGTVCFLIRGSQNQITSVCIDGRKGSPTRHRLFQQARQPWQPTAVLIELGAPEEGIVVPLISRWLDSDEAKCLLSELGLRLLRDALLRLGEPDIDG
jgi:hypothetical protein